jgi:hypothetical protein
MIVNQKHAFDFLQPQFPTLIPWMIPKVMQFLILAHSVLKPEKKNHTHTHTHTQTIPHCQGPRLVTPQKTSSESPAGSS